MEAQKYNNELFSKTGVKYKCNTLRDYYLIKAMYLLMKNLEDSDVNNYYKEIAIDYYEALNINNNDIKINAIDKTLEDKFYNYGITEGLYKYWQKYYYPTCLNFSSFLAIYSGENLPYMMFENTTNTALNKTISFIENQSVDMIRDELSNISYLMEDDVNLDYYLVFRWKAKNDLTTCKICRTLNGKLFGREEDLPDPHPNCRCTFDVEKRYK